MPHVDEFPGILGFTEMRFSTTESGLRSSGLKIKSLAFQLSKWNCPTGLDGGFQSTVSFALVIRYTGPGDVMYYYTMTRSQTLLCGIFKSF